VAADQLKPVYLLTGTDLPKIALALRRLRARFDAGSVDHLFAEAASGADAVAAVNALGLFGGGERLVIVEAVERWRKDDAEAVTSYLAAPTPGAVLALVGDPARLPGLETACKQAGDVLRYDVPTRRRGRREVLDYAAWVEGQLERAGVTAERALAERLVELVGDDTFALQREVEKLVAWAGGESVGPRDLDRLVVPMNEASIFALGDAWGSRDLAGALEASEAKLLHDEPFLIAARLADSVRRVRAVQALLEEELGVRSIAERLGLKEYPARKYAAQAQNFGPEELSHAVIRLAELDFALKGGSRLAAELELQRAIVDVTSPHELQPR
jgi:DNA polymerase-3 subunit delta